MSNLTLPIALGAQSIKVDRPPLASTPKSTPGSIPVSRRSRPSPIFPHAIAPLPDASSISVATLAGTAAVQGLADGNPGRFRGLSAVAVGFDGTIYIADSGNNSIRAVQDNGPNPATVTTIAGNGAAGFADGLAQSARFNDPEGIAVDGLGTIYVADTGNNRIRRIATNGIVTTLAGGGAAGLQDGFGGQATFKAPRGIALDATGNLYVADSGNSSVRVIAPNGEVKTLAGDGTAGENDSPSPHFSGVSGVAVDSVRSFVYLADTGNSRIRRLDSNSTVTTVAGFTKGFADGAINQARFSNPIGIAVDGAGKIIVGDTGNSRLRAIDPDQATVTTLAGTGIQGHADGPGLTAQFSQLRGLAISSASAILIADTGNHTLRTTLLPPVITSLSPSQAQPGDTIIINGERFDGGGPARNTVKFTRSAQAGGEQTIAMVLAATQTHLSVVVPPDAATGPVTVQTVNGTATSPTNFTVGTASPSISDFNPKNGPVGTVVTLSGSVLTAKTGTTTVTFAGDNNSRIQASVNPISSDEIHVNVPTGAITGTIELTNANGSAVTGGIFTVELSQDFQVTAAPATATTIQRSSATYVISITSPQPDFSQLVTLSASALPPGATATFDPAQITAGSVSALTLNLSSANLSPNNYSFTINGTASIEGHTITRSTGASVTVLAAGQTTLSGRVLSTANEPIMGATASLDGKSTTTDASGGFLLSGVTAGANRPVMVNGQTASAPNRTYPIINEAATVIAGQANVIPFAFYLPPIDVQNEVIVMPGKDTVATTPRLPDYKLTVPAGANLRNRDGSPVARMSVTPLPIDRIPAPLPTNVMTAEVWTAQPGGALTDIPIPVVYPNRTHAAPGSKCNLYIFDHDNVRWSIYGTGTVSSDGLTIKPDTDPSTGKPFGLKNFAWHFVAPPPQPADPPPCDPSDCDCARSIHTVDLATGNKIEAVVDISFGGARGMLQLNRTYTTGFSAAATGGRFGRGIKDNYDIKLVGTFQVNGSGRMVMPEEATGQLFSYVGPRSGGGSIFSTNATVLQIGDQLFRLPDNSFEYHYKDGRILTFNSSGSLTSMTDRVGNTTTLTYSGSNLTKVTDAVGRFIIFTYDGSGRVVTATDPLGRVWGYAYDGPGRLITITDPQTNTTKYTYDGSGRLATVTDKRGTVTKQITYDSGGRVSSETLADGGVEHYTYFLSGTLVTSTTVTDTLGQNKIYRFNASGYLVEQVDALGQVSKIERDMVNNLPIATKGPCGCVEESRTFDGNGNMTARTDRLGNTTHLEYEPVFNKVTKITDARGNITRFTYDAHGNLLSAIDALNETTTFAYDSFGELLSVSDPLGHQSKFEYDANGNITAKIDPLGNRSTMEYDAIGRLAAMIDPLNRRSSITYDSLGRIATVKDPAAATSTFAYDPNGNLISFTDALNETLIKTYDAKNRPVSITDAIGRISALTYDTEDELTSVISPSGRTTSYTYDPRRQVTSITDPLGGQINFTYDNRGDLSTLVDQRGNTTTFTYDELFRTSGRRDPLGQSSQMIYDPVGNISQKVDRLGRETLFTYDALNRPTRIDYVDATVRYTYDAAGRATRIDDTQSGAIAWAYDDDGRLLSETTPNGVVNYTYNIANQRASMTAADRVPVLYSYDTAGRLNTIRQNSEVFTYGYDVLSRVNQLQRPNNVTTTYAYDAVGRLQRLKHTNPQNQPIEDFQYTFNLDDEIDSITSLASAPLLPQASTVANADAANRIEQFGGASFTFDSEGQTTSKTDANGKTTFGWDARGRLVDVKLGDGRAVGYEYDSFNRRSRRKAGTETTNFLYDTQDVVTEATGDGSKRYYIPGQRVDEILAQSNSVSENLYFLQDQVNSTVGLTDSVGNIAERIQYQPFGNESVIGLTRYEFTGREIDSVTKLIFYRARYYDPAIGRFISEDPIDAGPGGSRYSYVGNDPIFFQDPSGLCRIQVNFNRIGPGYYHSYILTSDAQGTSYFRAGPSKGGPSSGASGALSSGSGGSSGAASSGSSSGAHSCSAQSSRSNSSNSSSPGSGGQGPETGPWGQLFAQHGSYDERSIDYNAGNPPTMPVIDDGVPCQVYNQRLVDAENAVNSANIPYNPLSTNSNAYVRNALTWSGLRPGSPPVWVPGWRTTLPH